MKYKDLLNYIIAYLYKVKRANLWRYVDLSMILNLLAYPATKDDLRDMVNYLEAVGYIHKVDGTIGGFLIALTTKGMIYYEDFEESYIEQIEKTFEEKGINRDLEQADITKDPAEEAKKNLVNEIERLISLFSEKISIDKDLISDLEILKIEILKRSPEKEIIHMKLDNLLESNIEAEKIRALDSILQ